MKKKSMNTNNNGFSLVELIIVIAIMAVLVGVLAPQFIKYVEKSRQSTDVQNIDQVATALRTYYADDEGTGTYSVKLSHANKPTVGSTGVSGTAALADAGIEDMKLKSGKWTSDSVEVTLDVTTGKTTKSGSATSYDANGNKIP